MKNLEYGKKRGNIFLCVVFGNVVLNNEGFYVGCSWPWRSHWLFSAQLNSYQKHPTHVVILGATCKHCWHVNHMPWKYCNGKYTLSQGVLKSHFNSCTLLSNIKKYFRTSLLFPSKYELDKKILLLAHHSNFLFKVSDKIAKCDFKHSLSPTTTLFLSCWK